MYNAPPQSAAAVSVAAHYLATMATDREQSSPSLSGLSCFFQEDDGDGDDVGGASDGALSGTQGGRWIRHVSSAIKAQITDVCAM